MRIDSVGDIFFGGTSDANADFVFDKGSRASFYRNLIVGGSAALATSAVTVNTDGYIFLNRSSGNALIVQQNGGGSSSDNKITLNTDGTIYAANLTDGTTTKTMTQIMNAAAGSATTGLDDVLTNDNSSLDFPQKFSLKYFPPSTVYFN